jgi:hypothetical protein
VREALSQYVFPLIEIDPVKPGDAHLYNAEYEHKKEVFGHKAIKDFIMRDMNKTAKITYTTEELKKWFESSEAPVSQKDLKQPQVPSEKCS